MKIFRSTRMGHVMQVVNLLPGLRVLVKGGGGGGGGAIRPAQQGSFGFVSSLYPGTDGWRLIDVGRNPLTRQSF